MAQLAGRGGHRDQHLVGLAVAEHTAQVQRRAEHADAVHAQVLLPRVVVEKANRRVAELRRALELAEDQLAGVAGADDHDLPTPCHQAAGRRALDQRAREQPRACDEREQQQHVDEGDPAR